MRGNDTTSGVFLMPLDVVGTRRVNLLSFWMR